MPNYQNGKVYKLITDINPELVYIGSTCQALSSRKSIHKSAHKRFLAGKGNYVTSFKIFEVDPNPIIVLLEACPCNSKEELHARERHWIENTMCVNRCIPGRTQQESARAYRRANREKVRERDRAYRRANREKLRERARDHYHANKEAIARRTLAYFEANKERLNAKATCGCGSTVYRRCMKRHERTKKHQLWAAEQ